MDPKESLLVRSVPIEWPDEPKTLNRAIFKMLWEIIIGFVFVVLSLAFFVFGVLVHYYDQTPVAEHQFITMALKEAAGIGPSVFPILFAAVVGRAIKAFIQWRIERGEKLGLLDLLAGSTTVGSAVFYQVCLRTFSIAGCLMIVIWALSPLGGQASLRVMSITTSASTTHIPVKYMSTNTTFSEWEEGTNLEVAGVNSIYGASILSPESAKGLPRDSWNNLKIPMLESLHDPKESELQDGWLTVPAENVTYSSLIGLPLSPLESDATTAFNIETSYWVLECPVLATGVEISGTRQDATAGTPDGNVTTWVGTIGQSSAIMSNSSFRGYCKRNIYTSNLEPRLFAYYAWDASKFLDPQSGAICHITTSYVEVEVDCLGVQCLASRIRRSRMPHPTPSWTFLDDSWYPDGSHLCDIWNFFTQRFIMAIESGQSGRGTVPQGYLTNPTSPLDHTVGLSIGQLDGEVFAQRLAQLLNTYWLAAIGWDAVLDGLSEKTASNNFIDDWRHYKSNYSTVEGRSTRTHEVIESHDRWLAILTISSLFLAVTSAVTAFGRMFTRTPEISFNVSTMIRDSPYVDTPRGGSTLDGTDLARFMKNMKVRYGDVAPRAPVGRLAIGSLGPSDGYEVVAPVRIGRKYE